MSGKVWGLGLMEGWRFLCKQ